MYPTVVMVPMRQQLALRLRPPPPGPSTGHQLPRPALPARRKSVVEQSPLRGSPTLPQQPQPALMMPPWSKRERRPHPRLPLPVRRARRSRSQRYPLVSRHTRPRGQTQKARTRMTQSMEQLEPLKVLCAHQVCPVSVALPRGKVLQELLRQQLRRPVASSQPVRLAAPNSAPPSPLCPLAARPPQGDCCSRTGEAGCPFHPLYFKHLIYPLCLSSLPHPPLGPCPPPLIV